MGFDTKATLSCYLTFWDINLLQQSIGPLSNPKSRDGLKGKIGAKQNSVKHKVKPKILTPVAEFSQTLLSIFLKRFKPPSLWLGCSLLIVRM